MNAIDLRVPVQGVSRSSSRSPPGVAYLPMELRTMDLSIIGSNPVCDILLKTFYFFLEYEHSKSPLYP